MTKLSEQQTANIKNKQLEGSLHLGDQPRTNRPSQFRRHLLQHQNEMSSRFVGCRGAPVAFGT